MNTEYLLKRSEEPSKGTVDFSSEIAMPLDSNASADDRAVTAEPRRGLKTVLKLCVLRGDKSLDFQTVHNPISTGSACRWLNTDQLAIGLRKIKPHEQARK